MFTFVPRRPLLTEISVSSLLYFNLLEFDNFIYLCTLCWHFQSHRSHLIYFVHTYLIQIISFNCIISSKLFMSALFKFRTWKKCFKCEFVTDIHCLGKLLNVSIAMNFRNIHNSRVDGNGRQGDMQLTIYRFTVTRSYLHGYRCAMFLMKLCTRTQSA